MKILAQPVIRTKIDFNNLTPGIELFDSFYFPHANLICKSITEEKIIVFNSKDKLNLVYNKECRLIESNLNSIQPTFPSLSFEPYFDLEHRILSKKLLLYSPEYFNVITKDNKYLPLNRITDKSVILFVFCLFNNKQYDITKQYLDCDSESAPMINIDNYL